MVFVRCEDGSSQFTDSSGRFVGAGTFKLASLVLLLRCRASMFSWSYIESVGRCSLDVFRCFSAACSVSGGFKFSETFGRLGNRMHEIIDKIEKLSMSEHQDKTH